LEIIFDIFMLWFPQVTQADVPHLEALDSYVIVQKDDVLDAIGTFVAAYLAELPEAQNLQPAQLQAALKTAFKVSTISALNFLACCFLQQRSFLTRLSGVTSSAHSISMVPSIFQRAVCPVPIHALKRARA